jgi:hypothetical protein
MNRGKIVCAIAALLLLTVCSFATENAFMAFDVGTQKMYAVVVGDAPFIANITYSQSQPDGYVGNTNTYVPDPVETWGEADLSPTDPARSTDLPDNTLNIITAYIDISDANGNYLYSMERTDTLLSDINSGEGRYVYQNEGCSPVMPVNIAIGSHFCAFVCHSSYTIPIVCEDPNYNPDLLEVSVSNGCDPAETHCDSIACPRVDWEQFRWFKRVFPNCQLFLTLTYCNADPGCVCIWRSDFILPVEMESFDAVGGDASVTVNWASASESGLNQYIVTRSDAREGVYHTVFSTDGAGTTTAHHNYRWVDTDVTNGHTYYYKLHVSDVNGTHVYASGGQTVIASATPGTGSKGGVPTDYSVRNYPNPFNSRTTFTFAIPLADRVSLKVYDLLGREVATVVDRYMPAATYSMNWSADGLGTGVYMYRLTSGRYSHTDKLLYIK